MSCVVIYQIHNIPGYGNSQFVDAAIKSKGQVEYYKIHKRQADPEQYRRCQGTKLVTEGSHKNVLSTFLAIRCVLCMLVGIYVLTHT